MPKKGSPTCSYYFDVRYVPIEPYPSHVLFIFDTTTSKAKQPHIVERLPVGLDERKSGIVFFPETAEHAANEVAKGLIKRLALNHDKLDLSTDDPDLAQSVTSELAKLGHPRLRIQTRNLVALSQRYFNDIFGELMGKAVPPLSSTAMSFFPPSQSIGFHNFRPPSPNVGKQGNDKEFNDLNAKAQYVSCLGNARPPAVSVEDINHDIPTELRKLEMLLAAKPFLVVRREADEGIAEAQLDYAIRLKVGLGCPPDSRLARDYLSKAASNPSAPPVTRSIAHSNLMDWYMESSDLRTRNLFLAAHHAEQALLHASDRPAPAVLMFGKRLDAHIKENGMHVMRYMYERVWAAKRKREEEYKAQLAANEKKRLKRPNAYRCAAERCGMEASHGKLFARCGGKCDLDKKPSYCSPKCRAYTFVQKEDWPNHKPFCKPGMPCSVLDTTMPGGLGANRRKDKLVGLPIRNQEGKTVTVLSSSTVDTDELKELRDNMAASSIGGSIPRDILTHMQLEKWQV
ncbi:hypothetical protein V5O48_010224 [Marasmius crinis-equi]|uniref:MYND-type domain-containing protein n=1 Tax=Marasmius crinis-equi TaxID=585013 RepID=A0ABR3F8Y4_9AGAR